MATTPILSSLSNTVNNNARGYIAASWDALHQTGQIRAATIALTHQIGSIAIALLGGYSIMHVVLEIRAAIQQGTDRYRTASIALGILCIFAADEMNSLAYNISINALVFCGSVTYYTRSYILEHIHDLGREVVSEADQGSIRENQLIEAAMLLRDGGLRYLDKTIPKRFAKDDVTNQLLFLVNGNRDHIFDAAEIAICRGNPRVAEFLVWPEYNEKSRQYILGTDREGFEDDVTNNPPSLAEFDENQLSEVRQRARMLIIPPHLREERMLRKIRLGILGF